MRTYELLGSAPCDEDCAQVGSPDYMVRARAECLAWKDQLERTFSLPEGMRFVGKQLVHEFGTYHEIALVHDDSNDEHLGVLMQVEDNLPTNWDEVARVKLAALLSKEGAE